MSEALIKEKQGEKVSMASKLEHIRTWLTVASFPIGIYIAIKVSIP